MESWDANTYNKNFFKWHRNGILYLLHWWRKLLVTLMLLGHDKKFFYTLLMGMYIEITSLGDNMYQLSKLKMYLWTNELISFFLRLGLKTKPWTHSRPPECWDYKPMPPWQANSLISEYPFYNSRMCVYKHTQNIHYSSFLGINPGPLLHSPTLFLFFISKPDLVRLPDCSG